MAIVEEALNHDHAVETAFAEGVVFGAQVERDRIAAILNLPETKGLERAAIAAALSGACSTEAVQQLLEMCMPPPAPVTNAEAARRRATFKIVQNANTEETHALETF